MVHQPNINAALPFMGMFPLLPFQSDLVLEAVMVEGKEVRGLQDKSRSTSVI